MLPIGLDGSEHEQEAFGRAEGFKQQADALHRGAALIVGRADELARPIVATKEVVHEVAKGRDISPAHRRVVCRRPRQIHVRKEAEETRSGASGQDPPTSQQDFAMTPKDEQDGG